MEAFLFSPLWHLFLTNVVYRAYANKKAFEKSSKLRDIQIPRHKLFLVISPLSHYNLFPSVSILTEHAK